MPHTVKTSLTIDENEFAWAKAQARARQVSVSRVVSAAVAAARQRQARRELLDALGGRPASARDIAEVGAWLDGAGPAPDGFDELPATPGTKTASTPRQ